MLLVFVENAGQILDKDKIIESVWPDKFVTDAALTKQILRLRKILGDQKRETPYIETHRGVGYRFTLAVEAVDHAKNADKPVPRPKINNWITASILAGLLLFAWIYSQKRTSSITPTIPGSLSDQAVTVAFLPSTRNQDWLNRGGLDYLADLLGKHELINPINPQPVW